MTASSAVAVHDPDLVLVLGDQFDEGGLPTPQSDWEVSNAIATICASRERERTLTIASFCA